jgi:myo-inositol-1(or 4)-monophosphatase
MAINTPLMNIMTGAVRKAARAILRDFGELENLQVMRKGLADFVTKADLKAEKVLREELVRTRPHYGFVMEEGGVIEGPDKSHRWFIDPLDGTINFMHGVPHFAVSVGLEREGHLVAGVVYNPVTDDMFTAEKGQGAWHNERRLRVSGRRELADALVATGIPHRGRPGHEGFLGEVNAVMREVSGVRRFGSRLGGSRALRRVLGEIAVIVGRGSRDRAGPGSGRNRERPCQRAGHADQRPYPGLQREPARAHAENAEGRERVKSPACCAIVLACVA